MSYAHDRRLDYHCHACHKAAGSDPDPGEFMRWLSSRAAAIRAASETETGGKT